MPTVKECIEHLQSYNPEDIIAHVIWTTEDVFQTAKENGVCLTQEQADEVIEAVDHHHDAELGITWDTLRCHIDDVQSPAECPFRKEDEGHSSDDRNCYECPQFKGKNNK